MGEDKNKTFIKNGKWYWRVGNNEEIKTQLTKFFFRLGNKAKASITENKELLTNEKQKTVQYQAWDYNLNKAVMREYLLIIEKPHKRLKEPERPALKRCNIRAKILGIKETNLEYI